MLAQCARVLQHHGVALLLLLLATLATGVRLQLLDAGYVQPDEQIAQAVVGKVLAEGTLDTNWKRTGVSEDFRYDQYNFSSAYLTAAGVEWLFGRRAQDSIDPSALLRHLRLQSCLLGGLIIVLAGLIGRRLGGGVAAITAALLTASCVTLMQDSLYARPETFVTALTLALLLAMTGRLRRAIQLPLCGLAIGFLIAAKFSFVVLLPLPPLLAVWVPTGRAEVYGLRSSHLAALIAMYTAALAFGFFAGAPYAVFAPAEYLRGVVHLLDQYTGGHWPHGLPDAGSIDRLRNGLAYLAGTQGWLVPVLAIVGYALLIFESRRVWAIVAFPLVAMLFYFLQSRVFFERNFSAALPLWFALAGFALREALAWIRASCDAWIFRLPRYVPAAASVALPLLLAYPSFAVSARLFQLIHSDDLAQRLQAEQRRVSNDGALAVFVVAPNVLSGLPELRRGLCGKVVYRTSDYGDPLTRSRLQTLLALGYHVVARVDGPFHGLPTSTLHTYHAADTLFLTSPEDGADPRCLADLVDLRTGPETEPVGANVDHDAGWSRDGYPASVDARGWTAALYASWNGSDANTGSMTIGPFQACGRLLVPFTTGPDPTGTMLEIDRIRGDRHEIIFSGPPPPVQKWSAIRIRQNDGACAIWRVRAEDAGTRWGQWIGLGMPVVAQDSSMGTPTAK